MSRRCSENEQQASKETRRIINDCIATLQHTISDPGLDKGASLRLTTSLLKLTASLKELRNEAAATGPASQSVEPDEICGACRQPKSQHRPSVRKNPANPLGLIPNAWYCPESPYSSRVRMFTPASGAAQGDLQRPTVESPLTGSCLHGNHKDCAGQAPSALDRDKILKCSCKCPSEQPAPAPVTPVGQSAEQDWIIEAGREVARFVHRSGKADSLAIQHIIRKHIPVAAPTTPHCPRCRSDKLTFQQGSDLVGWLGIMFCGNCGDRENYFDIEDCKDFAQFFSPALPGKEQNIESLLDRLCTSEDKTYCQRGRNELREILTSDKRKE